MAKKTKRLPSRRSGDGVSSQHKENPALTHANRLARLINTVCSCDVIQLKPDRSRYHRLVKMIYQHYYTFFDLLEGYELNTACRFNDQCTASFNAEFDYINQNIIIKFAPFIPVDQIRYPTGAKHCRITMLAATLDIEYYNSSITSRKSQRIYATNKRIDDLTLKLKMPGPSNRPILLMLGISYMGEEISTAARIINIGFDSGKLYIKKSDTLHHMNFDEEAPF